MKPRNCASGCRARPGSVEPLPLLRAYQGLGCLAAGQPVRGQALLLALVEEHPGSEAAVLAAEALAGEPTERSSP